MITPQLQDAHQELSKCSVQFLNFVKENSGALKRSSYRDILALNSELDRMQPWPVFMGRRLRDEMSRAALKVLDLIKSVPGRFFDYNHKKISNYYGISADLLTYLLDGVSKEHLAGLLARGDFIFSPAGLKCIEYNVNTNLGGLQEALWKSAYLRNPVITRFLKESRVKLINRDSLFILFDHLIRSALNRLKKENDRLNIALVSSRGLHGEPTSAQKEYLNAVYNNSLRHSGEHLKGEVVPCDFSCLRVINGDVYYRDRKIRSLIEWCDGFIPGKIMDVFKRGNILVYNGAVAWLLSNKLNLALLSEHEDSGIFDREEREVIKRYIPWTRRILDRESTYGGKKIKLKEFILSNREKMVLKPILGSGGEGIYIGKNTVPGEWRKLVDTALKGTNWQDLKVDFDVSEKQWRELSTRALGVKSWVVQEYVESYPYLFQTGDEGCGQYCAVWGFFVFGPQLAGGYGRILPFGGQQKVVNSRQGAQKCVIFEVDDRDEDFR